MTILEIIQAASSELSLQVPSTVINNTSVRQLLYLAQEDIRWIRKQFEWPELVREATITLVDGQASYALPADYDRQVQRTHWDQSNDWELVGPLTPSEWQFYKQGLTSTAPRKMFRVKSSTLKQFFVHPTPGAAEAGSILSFEYISKSCIRPVEWATGLSFLAGEYCFYDGNYYTAQAGGTASTTPPTHTSGAVTDGAITWSYTTAAYESYRKDSDVPLLDNDVHKKGVKWRWLKAKGLEWQSTYAEYMGEMKAAMCQLSGARTINMAGDDSASRFIDEKNIPDSGYG